MKPRLAYNTISTEPFKAMLALERSISHGALEAKIGHLVKLRVSQINGCAYCLDMHWKDLKALGETDARLYGLNAWGETPLYSEREQAALALAEAMTHVEETHVPDDVFEKARSQFSEQELVDLAWTIAAINAWNRIAITFRATPGEYRSTLSPAKVP